MADPDGRSGWPIWMADPGGFSRSLDASFQDTLAPGALIVGLAYLAIGAIHWIHPVARHPLLGEVELMLGVLSLGLSFYLRSHVRSGRFDVGRSRLLGALVIFPVLISNGIYLNIAAEPRHPFGFYILLVGTGMIPFTRNWYGAIVLSTLSLWGLSVWRSSAPLAEFVEPGVTILATTALGLAMHVWRFRYAERMDELRNDARRSRHDRDRYEARYRDMTENASDLIAEIDDEGRILYANPAHETVLGFAPHEMMGRPAIEFIASPAEEFASILTDPAHQRHVRFRHAAGGHRILECNMRPFLLETGERHLIATSRDVTDRIDSERARDEAWFDLESRYAGQAAALQSSLLELQRSERLAAMGTLAAGIAHQINNPIGSIQMSAELALLSGDDENARLVWHDALRNSVDQAKRCGQIVASMLQFARNEPTERAECDLTQIVLRVCNQTENYARNRNATIQVAEARTPLHVILSNIEIEQALVNILRNAVESASDGGRIRVRVSARATAQEAIVTVQDDGDGMDAAEVTHAFDPFFTTRLERGGTGLGLSVAHGVVTNHGGTLSLESMQGEGTTVTIRMPLNKPTGPVEMLETR